MKEKQIILEIPAIDGVYEVFIPTDITVKSLRNLLIDSVKEITNGRYVTSDTEVLCLKEQNVQLSEELIAGQYGIENGDTLFLL